MKKQFNSLQPLIVVSPSVQCNDLDKIIFAIIRTQPELSSAVASQIKSEKRVNVETNGKKTF